MAQPVKLTAEMVTKKKSCTTATPYMTAARCDTAHDPHVMSEMACAPSRQRHTATICGT